MNVTYGIILLPWGGILALFASKLMDDETHHVIWGGLVVACNALTGIFIMATYTGQLLASSFTLSQGLTLILMMTSPALGVVGGLLGVFWKTSWRQGAAVSGLAEASRRALLGGVILFFMILPATAEGGWIWLLPAFLVIVFSVLVYRGWGDRRLLGLLVIAGSLWAAFPFYVGDVVIDGYLVTAFPFYVKSPFLFYTRIDPVYTTWAFIGLVGTFLAVLGGLQTIFWKKDTTNHERSVATV